MLTQNELDFLNNPFQMQEEEDLAEKKKRELERRHQEKLASMGFQKATLQGLNDGDSMIINGKNTRLSNIYGTRVDTNEISNNGQEEFSQGKSTLSQLRKRELADKLFNIDPSEVTNAHVEAV